MWIYCLSVAVMNAKKRANSHWGKQEDESELAKVVDDKQHSILMTTTFSAVVCGDHDMLQRASYTFRRDPFRSINCFLTAALIYPMIAAFGCR
mmetsp:Transcript_5810/g.8570  ORF Transcript_5810/g.8570 Transcript_5810/m.8570 type:complete len:93 (-) Transcript_5810:73-351(-)